MVPGNASQYLRGVFSLEPEADLGGPATVFLETAHPSITLTIDTPPKAYLASDLSDPAVTPSLPNGIADIYRPCSIDPMQGYTLVYEVALPSNLSTSDQLNIDMCSLGGYDQVSSIGSANVPSTFFCTATACQALFASLQAS